MALSGMGLGFEFWARDRASPVMRSMRKEMGKTSDQAKELERQKQRTARSIKRGAVMMAAGVGALAVVNKATKAFGEFEFVLASAAAKMVDGTENLMALERAALRAGKLTQFSPTEAAQGLAELGAQGLSARESMAALRPVLDLAAGSMGQLGVGEAAGVAMAALNAFGKTVEDLPAVVDQLTKVSDSSAFQMRDFQVAISQAAAQAKASDQSFESMLATLGLLRDAGNEASSAATAYREAMRRVAGDKRAIKSMKDLGVSSVDSKGQMKDLVQIVAELHPALGKLGVQQRNLALKTIFGVRGMKAYSAIIASYEKQLKKGVAMTGEYTKGHDILMQRLGASHGAAAAKVKKALATTGGQYKLLAGSWQTTVIQFGKVFAKVMLPVLKKLTTLLNDLVDLMDSLSPTTRKVVAQVAVWGAVVLILIGALKVLRGLMMMMTLGRLAGRYIAGQAAMTTSTVANTAAVATQTKVYGYSATVLGQTRRAGAAMARGFQAHAGSIAMLGTAAVASGHFLGKWMVKKLDDGATAATKAEQKFVDFRLAYRSFNRTVKQGANYMTQFNQKLRDQTKILIKTAAVSGRAAEKVLSKVTATVGKLSIARQKALVGMYKAIRRKDIKAATTYRKAAFDIERKMAALAEARIHIRARQYGREIGFVKSKSKREHMAQTILLSGVVKQQQLEMGFAAKRREMAAGIRAIDDPTERMMMQEKADALSKRQQSRVAVGQMRIAKQAQKFGLLPKGFVSTADYDKIFARLKPLMKSTGIMGAQLQLSLKQLGAARRGVAVGRLTPGRIRAFGELREAGALAFGRAPKVAAAERGRYEAALTKGAAPAARKDISGQRVGGEAEENIRGYVKFWTAGLLGTQKEGIQDAIQRAYDNTNVGINITVTQGETAAEVTAKADGRSGKRFKPTVRKAGK